MVAASSTSVAVVAFPSASRPPAATILLLPSTAPATYDRATLRLGASAQLLVSGLKLTVVPPVAGANGKSGFPPPKLQSLPAAAALPARFVGLGMGAFAVQVLAATSKSQVRSSTVPAASCPPAT